MPPRKRRKAWCDIAGLGGWERRKKEKKKGEKKKKKNSAEVAGGGRSPGHTAAAARGKLPAGKLPGPRRCRARYLARHTAWPRVLPRHAYCLATRAVVAAGLLRSR